MGLVVKSKREQIWEDLELQATPELPLTILLIFDFNITYLSTWYFAYVFECVWGEVLSCWCHPVPFSPVLTPPSPLEKSGALNPFGGFPKRKEGSIPSGPKKGFDSLASTNFYIYYVFSCSPPSCNYVIVVFLQCIDNGEANTKGSLFFNVYSLGSYLSPFFNWCKYCQEEIQVF